MGNKDKDRNPDKKKKHKKHSTKSDKKQKVREKKSRRDDGNYPAAANMDNLATLLSAGILQFPSLLDELPEMIVHLNAGNFVNTIKMSDRKKGRFLDILFRSLPMELDTTNGWFSKQEDSSNNPQKINSFILRKLLELNAIKQPRTISIGEQLSSQKAPQIILEIVSQYPALKESFPSILGNILDGGVISMEDFENEEIRDGLDRLFKSIDLDFDDDQQSYMLPKDVRRINVMVAIQLLQDTFHRASQCMYRFAGDEQDHDDSDKDSSTSSGDELQQMNAKDASPSDGGSGDGDQEEEEDDPRRSSMVLLYQQRSS